jgi:lambda repressor-like predicted transcriptional regulator
VKYGESVQLRRLSARAAVICAATLLAGIATVANRAGWLGLSHLAASPRAVAEGKIWLLFTSGVVADQPWLPSLLGFAIVGFAALSLARARVVVVAALAGHVLATLVVYGFLGAADAVDHGAFANLDSQPDIGLSAIIAAWIGVISCMLWRRYRSRRAHALNVLACIGCALIGLAFRPDLNALDSEHIVAFALGVAVAAWWPEPTEPPGPDDLDRELEQLLMRA